MSRLEFVDDDALIAAAIAALPATFGLRGFPGDVFRASRRASYIKDFRGTEVVLVIERYRGREIANVTVDMAQDLAWTHHSKGSLAEIRRELRELDE